MLVAKCTGCKLECVDVFHSSEKLDVLGLDGQTCAHTKEDKIKIEVIPMPKSNEPCFCGSGKKYKKCCLNKRRS